MSGHKDTDPWNSSDDDSVSITSTIASEQKDEYVVEGVIAERKVDGEMQYLVRWEGYPDERCTWEPKSSFQSKDTLVDWQAKKARVSRGTEKPCDVDALLDRVETWIAATKRRKMRRRAKRIRLGLPVSPTDDTNIEDESDGGSNHLFDEQENFEPAENSISKQTSKSVDARISPTPNKDKVDSPAKENGDNDLPTGVDRIWTDEEEDTLIGGLQRLGGPYADQILALFGPSGTVNQSLRHKSLDDVQDKISQLSTKQADGEKKTGFLEKKSVEPISAKKNAPTAIMFPSLDSLEESDQLRLDPTSKPSSTPLTNGTFDISRSPITEKNLISPKSTLGQSEVQITEPREKDKAPRRRSISERESSQQMSRIKLPASSVSPFSGTSRALPPTGQGPNRHESKHPSSKESISGRRVSLSEPRKKPGLALSVAPAQSLAHKPKQQSLRDQATQMGSSGRGPARLGAAISASKHVLPKKSYVSGAAIFANWGQNPTRKSNSVHRSFESASKKSVEKFGKLSTLRRFEKRGRNEPAPNIESLTFLDLKHGNAKRPSLAKSNAIAQSQTPYQLIQESLARDQTNLESPTPDEVKSVAEVSGQGTTAQIDETFEPADYTEPASAGSSHIDATSASPTRKETTPTSLSHIDTMSTSHSQTEATAEPLDSETVKASSDLRKRPPISLQTYKEKTLPNLASPSNKVTPIIPQGSSVMASVETSTPEKLGVQITAPRNDIASDSRDEISELRQSAPHSIPSAAQMDLISSHEKHDVMATLVVGEEYKILGDVRFRGLGRNAKVLFLSMKTPPRQMHIWCQKICPVREYQTTYHTGPAAYFGGGHSGFIVPWTQTASAVLEMAEMLKLRASCAIFSHTSFTLLIYPINAGLESWDFLNFGGPNLPDGAMLKFLIRKPLPLSDVTEIEVEMRRRQISIRHGESNVSILVRNMLGIEYERLIQQPTPELTAESNNFFLFFINADLEYRIIYKFLQSNGGRIFSWDTEGSWDYFVSHVENGVILIEGSFWEIHLIPYLPRVLRKRINVFNITFYKDLYAPHPHINRILPHGHALLITDSFILLCPHEAARFLRWFRFYVLTSKPAGTWQLCTRPHIRDYILCLVEARNTKDGHVFMQIYESLWHILPNDFMEDDDNDDDDDEFETLTDEAPIHCMSGGVGKFDHDIGKGSQTNEPMNEDAIARNDSTHVEWFAGWSLTVLERFRRFTVISGARGHRKEAGKKEWESRWSHIEVVGPDTLFEKQKIPEWEAREKKHREQAKGKARTEQDKRSKLKERRESS